MSNFKLTAAETEHMLESEVRNLQRDIAEMLRTAYRIECNFLHLPSRRFKCVHDLAVDFACLATELEASARCARYVSDHLDGMICYEEDADD